MSACNIYDAGGNLIWSLGDYGSVMCDVVNVQPNAAPIMAYPAFVGRALFVETIYWDGYGSGSPTVVSYPSGVPTVTFSANTKTRTCYIWAE